MTLPLCPLSALPPSPPRLGGLLTGSLRARGGRARGPAGPRVPWTSPPSSQTTTIWATTCGPTCFKVRAKGKGGDGEHPRSPGAGKACGVATPSWTSRGRALGYIPRDPRFMAPKACCLPGRVPSAVAVQSPGKSVLTADHPSQLAISSPAPNTPGVLICQDQAPLAWAPLVTATSGFWFQAQALSGCGLT